MPEKLTIHKILVNSVTSLKIPLGQIYRQPYQLQEESVRILFLKTKSS